MDAFSHKRLIDKVSLLILSFWIGILVIRLIIAPLESSLIIVSIACLAIFSTCHFLVMYLQNVHIAGLVLLPVFAGSILFMTWMSGGIQSPAISIYPLIPIIATLLFGKILSWSLCLIMAVCTIIFYLLGVTANASSLYAPELEMRDRLIAVWVVFSTTTCTVFTNFFYTENQHLNNALQNQARTDYLTNLPNKRAIEECLRRETALTKRTGGWISVIMLDIDFFKRYNDVYGHAKGDECLKLIANSLKETLKRVDDFVGRYGGEEFIVLLPDTNPDACMQVAETMRLSIESLNRQHPDILKIPVTITLGCYSTTAENIASMDELVSRADRALYNGKRLGRNQIVSTVDRKIGARRRPMNTVANINEHQHRRQSDPDHPKRS